MTKKIAGPTPYIGKLIGIFINMDTMIGNDFETDVVSGFSRTSRSA